MNIDGLSESTLEKFIELGWINNFVDIYLLHNYESEMQKLEGFGKKSVDKLLQSIEKSRRTDLSHFLNAIGIPGCGKSTSKDIAAYCNGDIYTFLLLFDTMSVNELSNINGIGESLIKSIEEWFNTDDFDIMTKLLEDYIIIEVPEEKKNDISGVDLTDKTYVITGSLSHFENRDRLKELIESMGGRVGSSVTSKTTVLINNDIHSTSSKNKKANELNIPIWSEEQFLDSIGYSY